MGKTSGPRFVLLRVIVLGVAAACGDDGAETTEPQPQFEEPADAGLPAFSCAGEVCEMPAGMTGELCCADQFTGGCGLMRGAECRRVSKPDDRCPKPGPAGPASAIHCCAENGECGLDLGLGLGCTAISQSCGYFPRNLIMELGSMTCDGEVLELPEECGAARRDAGMP